MNRKIGGWLFLIFFLVAVVGHYGAWSTEEQSLFLARFDDPAPRFSFYPWLMESARQFRAGYFPLWTSREGAGFPLLANYQSTPFNPFNLAFEIFPWLKLLDFMVILKLLLLGVFTYLFALELGLSPLSGACSAVVLCFSGYVSKYLNQINMNSELWLPAGLWLAEKMLKDRRRLIHFLLLALVTALALVGGNPEAAFYFLFFILLYALVRGGWSSRKPLYVICCSFMLGFLVSAYQLLSFIDYLGYGWHIHSSNLHTLARAPVRWFFSLFFPWLFGPYRTHPAQLFLASYVGLVPAFLSLMAVFRTRCFYRAKIFFWGYALLFLAVVYQMPPLYYLTSLPVFNRIGSFKFAFFGVNFCLAMLAGTGLENYISARLKSRQLGFALAAASGLAIFGLLLAQKFPLAQFPVRWHREAWLWPMIIFIIALAVALYGIWTEERKFCGALLVFLALVNLLHLSPGLRPESQIDPARWRFKNPVPPSYLIPVLQDPARPRFTGLDQVFHQNQNLVYGVSDWRVFEAMFTRSYVRVMAEIEGFSMEQSIAEFFAHGWSFDIGQENLPHPLVNELGIRYLLSRERFQLTGFKELMMSDGVYVYRNERAWPRAWLMQNQAPVFGKVEMQSDEEQKLIISVTAEAGGQLVLADQYAPGWRARSLPDGKELIIQPERGIFRKLELGPGEHQIEFWYQPRGFELGWFASLVSSVLVLTGMVLAAAKRRAFQRKQA